MLVFLAAVFATFEFMGWPFLVEPLQTLLQNRFGRSVRLNALEPTAESASSHATVHLWGGIALHSPLLKIGAPSWSTAPYLLLAHDVDLHLRYGDLWRAYQGQQQVIQSLKARQFYGYLERTADGRTSWQIAASGHASLLPRLETVEIQVGQLQYQDALHALNLNADLRLSNSKSTLSVAPEKNSMILHVVATGHYRKEPFHLTLTSTGSLPWKVNGPDATPVAVQLIAKAGSARLDFNGTAQDFLHLNGLNGQFTVAGPSLATVGAPLGITLPTTKNFKAAGALTRSGNVWQLALRHAQVGASNLGGRFTFDTSATVPRLTGTLEGAELKLADLGPAVGAVNAANTALKPSKVLPTRPFDLASLHAMNADVLIRLQQFDTNTQRLEPLRPFNAHLLLSDGVLVLKEIEARTAQGSLGGMLTLNGQADRALWVAALKWHGVELQRWIHQARRQGLPPYISGELQGHANLRGSGRSTAEILSTLQGDLVATVANGTVSHLLVEIGGLDIAESLGVYLKGDNALKLDCAQANLTVDQVVIRPRELVIDTSDSTV